MSDACKHGGGQYQKVFDARKRRLRGLWERNGTFYGQLTITDPGTGSKTVRRVRLKDKEGNPVTTTPQAVATLNKLKSQRADDNLKIAPKRTPILNPRRWLPTCESNSPRDYKKSGNDDSLVAIRRQLSGSRPRNDAMDSNP
jgi:hypothetical protein